MNSKTLRGTTKHGKTWCDPCECIQMSRHDETNNCLALHQMSGCRFSQLTAPKKKGAIVKLRNINPAAAQELSRVLQVTLAMCCLARCSSSDGKRSLAIAFVVTLCHRIILLFTPRECSQQERFLFIVPHIHPESCMWDWCG